MRHVPEMARAGERRKCHRPSVLHLIEAKLRWAREFADVINTPGDIPPTAHRIDESELISAADVLIADEISDCDYQGNPRAEAHPEIPDGLREGGYSQLGIHFVLEMMRPVPMKAVNIPKTLRRAQSSATGCLMSR